MENLASASHIWRVFVAIEIPFPIREELRELIRRLRETLPHASASWTRPESVHLTLKFLGNIARDQVTQLSAGAARAAERSPVFTIGVAGTGVFPNHRAPRVLWVGLRDEKNQLKQLHDRLETECAELGFTKEDRAFNPHLTIARLRQPQHARSLANAHQQMAFKPAEFSVSEILVIRSELSSAGSRYTTISRHPLAG